MSFWGAEVKPGCPIRYPGSKNGKWVRITQATLGDGESKRRSVLRCRVGRSDPAFVLGLLPENVESCRFTLEFKKDDVVFSVVGQRSIYLAGYYVHDGGGGGDDHHQANSRDNDVKQDLPLYHDRDHIQDSRSGSGPAKNEDDTNVVDEITKCSFSGEEKDCTANEATPEKVHAVKPTIDVDVDISFELPPKDSQRKEQSPRNDTTKKNHQEGLNEMITHDVKTLSNGLIIEELAKGDVDGEIAMTGKKVFLHFTGMLKENGQIFESTNHKSPCKVHLGDEAMIDGFHMGVNGMSVGSKRRLIIPPSMGFGEDGYEEIVPPNASLVYEVELFGFDK